MDMTVLLALEARKKLIIEKLIEAGAIDEQTAKIG